MAPTTVVAGTATAVSNRVSRRQTNRWANQQPQYAPEPQYAEPAGPPRTDTNTTLAQLRELAELRDSGVLDEPSSSSRRARSSTPHPGPPGSIA